MRGIYAGEDISDIERFIIFIFLLCYYYTGHDEKTYDSHLISSPPNLTQPREDTLATRVSFSLRNVEKWDIMGVGFR